MRTARRHRQDERAAGYRLLINCLLAAVLLWALAGHAPAGLAALEAAQADTAAICVDGGDSGKPFVAVNCVRTVTTLAEAVDNVSLAKLIVVRAFASSDPNSIAGMGTYRDQGLASNVMLATASDPIIIQAEGWHEKGYFVKPIVDGAMRVTQAWELVPGTEATWQTPWDEEPGGFGHEACIDRIWVSRVPGKTQLANFPLTRPMFAQGNDHLSDCGDNTFEGQPMTPQHVDSFPGSYQWLDGMLYVRLPNGEDPNRYTVEVPFRHAMSPGRGSAGLVVRGFRVYHAQNGIDLWHCGSSPADRCDATHNETSYNTPFGLQPGKHGRLLYNTGVLNTLQLIKVTSDFADIGYNVAGPQLSHGFKLNVVHDCLVHHNEVYGNVLGETPTGTQAGWRMLGTRDATVGIYLKNETQRCEVYENYVHHNAVGIYLRNDGDTLTEGNLIENNSLVYNTVALGWRDDGMWDYNTAADNVLGWGAVLRWGDETGSVSEFQAATGTAAGK
jgi:parallel beta-helix repeat protein